MARIELGNVVLESYAHGWKVGQPGTREVDGRTVKTVERPSYRPTIQSAIEAALDLHLRHSEVETLEELREELEGFRHEVAGLFRLGTFHAVLAPEASS